VFDGGSGKGEGVQVYYNVSRSDVHKDSIEYPKPRI